MAFNSQRNKYLHRSPQAVRLVTPLERCYYFKVPKWLGPSEAMRDAFPLALGPNPIHFWLRKSLHVSLTQAATEDRGSLVNEDPEPS